jgi:hypothetical protein
VLGENCRNCRPSNPVAEELKREITKLRKISPASAKPHDHHRNGCGPCERRSALKFANFTVRPMKRFFYSCSRWHGPDGAWPRQQEYPLLQLNQRVAAEDSQVVNLVNEG